MGFIVNGEYQPDMINTKPGSRGSNNSCFSFDMEDYKGWLSKNNIQSPNDYVRGIEKIQKKYDIRDVKTIILTYEEIEKRLTEEIGKCSSPSEKHILSNQRSALRKFVEYLNTVFSCSYKKENVWNEIDYQQLEIGKSGVDQIEWSMIKEDMRSRLELVTRVPCNMRIEIILSSRKKKLCEWFETMCRFVAIYNSIADDCFSVSLDHFNSKVRKALEANDASNHQDWIQKAAETLLYEIIGYAVVNNDTLIVNKATDFLDKIKIKAPFVVVVNGEYACENLDNADMVGYVTLYLNNIHDTAYNKLFLESLVATFAHELFHHHHFTAIWKAHGNKFPNDFNRYDPWKIICESLASRFECYIWDKAFKTQAGNPELRASWREPQDKFWEVWPYAGACLIYDGKKFREVFSLSLQSTTKTVKALGI